MNKLTRIKTANRACSLIYCYINKYRNGTWLLPVNVCPDVPLTFCLANVKFQFVDIDSVTLCINEETCLSILKNNTDICGIFYVRTYGFTFDTTSFFSICRELNPNLKIIDDRCLCIPEIAPNMYDSDMVLYSTGKCKQIDLGGGGLAYLKKKEIFEIDNNLVYTGVDEESIYKEAFKRKEKLDSIPSGWLNIDNNNWSLEQYNELISSKIESRLIQRKMLNSIYRELLPKSIQLSDKFQNWRFNIVVPLSLKEMIVKNIFNEGLFVSSHYHSVNRLFDKDKYTISDNLFDSVINMFNDDYYSEDKAIKTCNIINKILLKHGSYYFQ